MTEIESVLFEFIRENFEVGDSPDYTPDVNLFDYGFVDSLGSFEIISFVEKTWNIRITQKDITLYPRNSVREIAAVIANKV
jgi:methoxymalonate biosynthesis acyl carrier protein